MRDERAQLPGVAAHDLDAQLVVREPAAASVAVRAEHPHFLHEEHDGVEGHRLREGTEHADAASRTDDLHRLAEGLRLAADRLDDDIGAIEVARHLADAVVRGVVHGIDADGLAPSPSGADAAL